MKPRICIIDRWTEEKKKGTIILELKIINRIFNRSFVLLLFVAAFKYILLQIREIQKLLQEYFNKFY